MKTARLAWLLTLGFVATATQATLGQQFTPTRDKDLLAQARVAPGMSLEELAVRRAYARLSYATETDAVYWVRVKPSSTADLATELSHKKLSFTLSSVRTGNIAELLDATYGDLFTQPVGPSLQVSTSKVVFTQRGQEVSQIGATARWDDQVQDKPLDLSMTLGTVFHMGHLASITKYVTAQVTAAMDGRNQTYKALFLFDAKGNVVPLDTFTQGALATFFNKSAYPHVLLETMVRTHPIIGSWISSRHVDSAACISNQDTECCDVATMSCGVTPSDVSQSRVSPPARVPHVELDIPVDPKNRAVVSSLPAGMARTNEHPIGKGSCSTFTVSFPDDGSSHFLGSDNTAHLYSTGNHNLNSTDSSGCVYYDPTNGSNDCNTEAWAKTQAYMHDDGKVAPFTAHSVQQGQTNGDSFGYGAVPVSATAYAAGTVQVCYLWLICGVNITAPPFNLPTAGSIWSPVVPRMISCAPQTVPEYGTTYPTDPTPCWVYGDGGCGYPGPGDPGTPIQAQPLPSIPARPKP